MPAATAELKSPTKMGPAEANAAQLGCSHPWPG